MAQPAPIDSTAFAPVSHRTIVLTGPTASGKSALAIRLAQTLNAEIISLDSIAVYRGMDVGTAKPSREDRAAVGHHLIDVVDPIDDFSAAQFLTLAHRAVDEILERGRRPMFVGGTPMYLKALVYGFDPGPPADWEFRRSVDEDLKAHGQVALHERLRQVDPLSAHRLAPTDTRRVTRALEVAYLTGIPLSHRQTQFERLGSRPHPHAFVIRWPRETLHERIELRVNEMFRAGLVDEVQGLLERHGRLSRTAASAVGYREVIEGINQSLDTSVVCEQVLFHTRQLARRQETWFRSMPMLKTIDVSMPSEFDRAYEEIVQRCQD